MVKKIAKNVIFHKVQFENSQPKMSIQKKVTVPRGFRCRKEQRCPLAWPLIINQGNPGDSVPLLVMGKCLTWK